MLIYYLLLFSKNIITSVQTPYGEHPKFKINIGSGKILILLDQNNKCIEINVKNLLIIKDQCYIIDSDKRRHNIIFDLPIQKYPFTIFVPNTAPLLCYQYNNTYKIEIIISNSMSLNNSNDKYKNLLNPEINKEYVYEIYQFNIALSYLFPNALSVNKDMHDLLFKIYNETKTTIDYNGLKHKYKYDITKYNEYVDNLLKLFITFIDIDKEKLSNFKDAILTILDKDDTFNYEEALTNFLSDFRLCKLSGESCKSGGKIDSCAEFIVEIKRELDKVMKDIIYNDNMSIYILQNLDKWIKIIELNILLSTVENMLTTSYTCWDVQNILNILNNIKNFNEKLDRERFYVFELIFLLQNDYIFTKKQLEKYKQILEELNPDGDADTQLKLHQFMMGKGKTSVFTPLLAFAVKLLKNKNPTIITSSHLVKDTKQIMLLTEYLLTTNDYVFDINVFSDFNAKKRWLEITTNIKKDEDLTKEYNIIDEFDSHHNYLQSMFNYVLNKKDIINLQLFRYIYFYTLVSLGLPIKDFDKSEKISEIQNNDLFNKYFDSAFNQTSNMIYNKDYGFEFLVSKIANPKNIIASPFVRKDTPVNNSNFSNILLRLILTFKTYIIQFDKQLQDFDFKYLELNTHIINKLINIKPKWGMDFSMDYYDSDGNTFEVLHWEYDGFDYDEMYSKKLSVEKILCDIDWDDAAKQLLKRKNDWYNLDFFKQSDYKCNYFGIGQERWKMIVWN